MPDAPMTPDQYAQEQLDQATAKGKTVASKLAEFDIRGWMADHHVGAAIRDHLAPGTWWRSLIDAGFTFAGEALAGFFLALSAFRKETTHTFDATTVEVVNEFLGTNLDASVMAVSTTQDEGLAKANKIGSAVLDRLETEFTTYGTDAMTRGAAGARTFAGFGINFAIQNAIISLLGACIPETRLEDLRELGVEVAQNLGLGRLMNRALRPLVENTITKPYNRQLQRKYQQDLLGYAELAEAYLAGRMSKDTAMELLRQHGISDDQINELISQKQPRLHAEEYNLLDALGQTPQNPDDVQDLAHGMPGTLFEKRNLLLSYKRLSAARNRALAVLLQQISTGFLAPTDLDTLMQKLQLPNDEQDLWRQVAGYLYERVRTRPSQADILFLYEASQITDGDVQLWLMAEGYSPDDVQRMLTFFRLKAVEAASKTTGGAAAKAVHLHNEHTAFMTDLITGWWGRPPTANELYYWVNLLDTAQRTKADVKNELKTLDTSGAAIPPQ